MKYLLNLASMMIIMIMFSSCKTEQPQTTDRPDAVIVYEASDEDRPMYNVTLPDGRVLENMYAEEVCKGLLDGQWTYDQTLRLANDSEYQVFVEDRNFVIMCYGRHVATIPMTQIPIIDSVFAKDNR